MNPRFWEMIEASRKNPKTYSIEEVREYFAEKDAKPSARAAKRKGGARPPGKVTRPVGRQPGGARLRARG